MSTPHSPEGILFCGHGQLMETPFQNQPSQNQKQVSLFLPYCAAVPGAKHLKEAMAIFSQGQLMGARQIQGGPPIAFSLQWQPGQLPADPCPCTLTIPQVQGACYRFSVPSHQAVVWFLQVYQSQTGGSVGEHVPDMPQSFWTQLFSA